jgi:hypothetical protein
MKKHDANQLFLEKRQGLTGKKTLQIGRISLNLAL